MKTYEDLIAEAKDLERQAQELLRAERAVVIADIKEKMAKYAITPEMLAAKPKRQPGEARYIGPNGERWTGGPGRRPTWVTKLQAQGIDIEQYRVQ